MLLNREFARRFGAAPTLLARAPGRVNLIGEHTDYNDGFVLPMAIDREVCIALRPRADEVVSVHSLDFDESAEFSTTELAHGGHSWIEYLKGVAWAMAEGRPLRGWDGVLAGDVPRGAGLSSSAALEMAALRAFLAVNEIPWNARAAALLGRRVENEWIGVNSGIMDQLIVAAGQAEHALLLDCRTLAMEAVPMPAGVAVVIMDTGTRRGLVESAYNERRAQCESAARLLGVAALRDVDSNMLAAGRAVLDEVTYRRAQHVVSENARTLRAAAALKAGDSTTVGGLMNDSHTSLRDDFEVTNHELNVMAAIAQQHDACYGARMTGAGFGGCAIALVDAAQSDRFIPDVADKFHAQTGLEPRLYACRAAGGASIENLNESVHS